MSKDNKVTKIDVTNVVKCDSCNADHSNKSAPGGFLFQSKAICPECVPRWREQAQKYGEAHFITAEAGPKELFRDFAIRMRGGDNTVTVIAPADDPMHDIVKDNLTKQ
jgi:hypothetical protein